MKRLIILLFSIVIAGEMEVEGDLKVTGNIQNDSLAQVIANLQAQITALQAQVAHFECINSGNIPAGYCDCFGNVVDVCGDCGGDAQNEDVCDYIDADGNVYQIVQIGNQIWMAENLKVEQYIDGKLIGVDSDDLYYYYADSIQYSEVFGNLYN